MIFVTIGSQKFQFNRLLKAVDRLIEEKEILEDVFAQIGYSDYQPKYYPYRNFLDRDEFSEILSKASIVITHGGTGSIIGALKKKKKIIAVPRLAKFDEHIDDHQLQLVEQFEKQNLVNCCYDCSKLKSNIAYVKNHHFNTYNSNTKNYIDIIDDYLTKMV